MSKKRILAAVLIVILGILMNVAVLTYHLHVPDSDRMLTLEVTMSADTADVYKVYYLTEDQNYKKDFNEGQMAASSYSKADDTVTLRFVVPGNAAYVRLDEGMTKKADIEIYEMTWKYKIMKMTLSQEQMENYIDERDVDVSGDEGLTISSTGTDPFLVWDAAEWNLGSLWTGAYTILFWAMKILICAIIDTIIFVIFRHFSRFISLPKELWANRVLIWRLSKNDFKTRFAGSFFGIVWAFIQPIVTVLVYWFVFEKGLRATGVNTKAGIEVPFVLWLIAGMVPWFFFQEALSGGTGALMEYSYLVKKVVFKISILPIVKVISALFVHLFFIGFTLVLYTGYRYYPDLYTLQIIYYSFALFVFTLALVYGTCAIVIFFKDLSQIINILLQVLVWLTPIMWNIDGMDLAAPLRAIFKLNPLYYIVSGYRDSLINKVWFWENPGMTLYFWILTVILLGIGGMIFKKLKVHFADVL